MVRMLLWYCDCESPGWVRDGVENCVLAKYRPSYVWRGGGGGGGQLLRASTPNDISLTAQNVLARISPTIHPEPQTPFPRVPGHSSKCLQCENRRERICPRFTKCLQSRKCWERHGAWNDSDSSWNERWWKQKLRLCLTLSLTSRWQPRAPIFNNIFQYSATLLSSSVLFMQQF